MRSSTAARRLRAISPSNAFVWTMASIAVVVVSKLLLFAHAAEQMDAAAPSAPAPSWVQRPVSRQLSSETDGTKARLLEAWLQRLRSRRHPCFGIPAADSAAYGAVEARLQGLVVADDHGAPLSAAVPGGFRDVQRRQQQQSSPSSSSSSSASSCLTVVDWFPFPGTGNVSEAYVGEDIMGGYVSAVPRGFDAAATSTSPVEAAAQAALARGACSTPDATADAFANAVVFPLIPVHEGVGVDASGVSTGNGADGRSPRGRVAGEAQRRVLSALRSDAFRRVAPLVVVLGREAAPAVHAAMRHGATVVVHAGSDLLTTITRGDDDDDDDDGAEAAAAALAAAGAGYTGGVDAWVYAYAIGNELHASVVVSVDHPLDVHYDLADALAASGRPFTNGNAPSEESPAGATGATSTSSSSFDGLRLAYARVGAALGALARHA